MNHALATQLREGTAEAHTMAENVGFVRGFLAGVVDKRSYRQLVANFYYIYGALEAELERHKHHPVLSLIHFPELWREQSLQADLSYYYGPNWQAAIKPSPACETYVAQIKAISNTAPELLVAHAYTRYMGDLSGGQILKNIAKRAMGLSDGAGVAFYDFQQIRNPGPFKNKYRAALDALPISDEQAAAIVQEANASFHMNMKMFKELEGNWFLALVRLTWNSLLAKIRGIFKPSPTPSEAN